MSWEIKLELEEICRDACSLKQEQMRAFRVQLENLLAEVRQREAELVDARFTRQLAENLLIMRAQEFKLWTQSGMKTPEWQEDENISLARRIKDELVSAQNVAEAKLDKARAAARIFAQELTDYEHVVSIVEGKLGVTK